MRKVSIPTLLVILAKATDESYKQEIKNKIISNCPHSPWCSKRCIESDDLPNTLMIYGKYHSSAYVKNRKKKNELKNQIYSLERQIVKDCGYIGELLSLYERSFRRKRRNYSYTV
jgi:hypothetical protein